jgi:glycosyltransferase involved in cell wall biosynthesis
MGLRLAVVVDTFPRWSERFLARELNELRRRGIELTVFALRQGARAFVSDPEFEPLRERVRVLPGGLPAAVRRLPGLRRDAQDPAWQALRGALGWPGLLRATRARLLAEELRAGGFTHVHAHFANWPSTLAWLAAKQLGLPFSFSAHARDLFVEAQLLAEKARDATALFACHRLGWERLRALPGGAGAEKAILMYHGLPLEDFPFRDAPRARARPDASGTELLAAGRFVAKKGLGDLLAALAGPALRGRVLRLTLVGDGPGGAALRIRCWSPTRRSERSVPRRGRRRCRLPAGRRRPARLRPAAATKWNCPRA